jgi:hypothetical protein
METADYAQGIADRMNLPIRGISSRSKRMIGDARMCEFALQTRASIGIAAC